MARRIAKPVRRGAGGATSRPRPAAALDSAFNTKFIKEFTQREAELQTRPKPEALIAE